MPKQKRYFGITKIRRGQKLCWISKQDKNGWSLGLALPSRTVWLTGLRFKTRQEIEVLLKLCWISKQDKNGWSLGLALPSRTVWLTGLRFKTRQEIEVLLDGDIMGVVFVHLKGSEEDL